MRRILLAMLSAAMVCGGFAFAADQSTVSDSELKNINTLLDGLASADAGERQKARWHIEDLPATDLPALRAALNRQDLPADSRSQLQDIMSSLAPRLEARARKIAKEQSETDESERGILANYENGGHTNPKWDADAKAALHDFIISGTASATKSLPQIQQEFEAAINSGCDDPEIQYTYVRLRWSIGGNPPDLFQLFVKGVEAMESSPNIPTLYKALPHIRLVNAAAFGNPNWTDDDTKKELALTVEHFNDGVKSTPVSASSATLMLKDIVSIAQWRGGGRMDMFNQIYPALEAAYPNAPEPLVFKAATYVNWAWEARGGGWGYTITPQGQIDMTARLAVANEALAKAYSLAPDDPAAATEMLRVELGQGKGRDVMEMWFKRAMTADPDNYTVCEEKMEYLKPKWYGTPQDMLDFGHQCLAEGNWWGHIPFVLIDAHRAVSEFAPDVRAYYAQPEVWKDVQSVYDPFLERYPDADWLRSRYAWWACECGQWKSAIKLFDELGDKVDLTEFNGKANYDYYRRKAVGKVKAEMGAK